MPTSTQIEFVASLYIGYFNRAPDPAGFVFWLDVVDKQAEALGAESLAFQKFLNEDLPQFFAENPEPRSVYPFLETPSPESAESFLTNVYQNLFGRNPDEAGLEFYRDALLVPVGQAGNLSPGQAISQIINGAVTAPDSVIVANKVDVGLFFFDNILPKIGSLDPAKFEGEARKSAETILTSIDASTSSRDLAKSLISTTIGAEDPSEEHPDGIFFEDFFFQTSSGNHEASIQGLKNLNVIGDIGGFGDASKLVVNNSKLIIADDIALNSGSSTISFSGAQTGVFLTGSTSSNNSTIRLSARNEETASANVFISDGAQVTVNHSREGASSAIRIAMNKEAEFEDNVLTPGGQSVTGALLVEGDQTKLSIINSGGGRGSLSIASVEKADDAFIDTTVNREANGLVVVRDSATITVQSDIHIADANNVADARANGALIVEGEETRVIVGDDSSGGQGFMRIAEEGGTGTLIVRDGAHMTLLSGEEYGGGIELSGGSDRIGGTAHAEVTGEGTVLNVEHGSIAVGRNIGEASLTVSDGATVSARSLSTGQNSTGTITIEGPETSVILSSNRDWSYMDIGIFDTEYTVSTTVANLSANGTVLIRDGATVSIEHSSIIGDANNVQGATATGTLIIEGQETRVTLGDKDGTGQEGFMRIAEEGGTGTLILRDGAYVEFLAGNEYGGNLQLSGGSDRIGGTAHAEVIGEGTVLDVERGSISVGRNIGEASLTVSDGAQILANSINAGRKGTGNITFEGGETRVTLGGESGIGQEGFMRIAEEGGTGTLILRDGAYVEFLAGNEYGGNLQLSGGSDRIGGTAHAEVIGEGTVLDVERGSISVGRNIGEASLTVSDGAQILANSINAGRKGTGNITFEGGETRVTLGGESGIGQEGFIRIAEDSGTGTLILRDGAHMTLLSGEEYGGGIQLSGGSDRIGGTARAEVTGEGTYLFAENGYIAVGQNAGTATFTLSDGADVDTLFFTSGRSGAGHTTIEDVGTSLTLSGSQIIPEYGAFLSVGRDSEGTFTVQSGADVSIIGNGGPFPGIQVGRSEGAVGELTITGAGSSIIIDGATNTATRSGESGFIEIGRNAGSSGTVNVLDGGLFQNDNDGVLTVGSNAESHGIINIIGVGSKFEFGATAYIAPEKSGEGIVTVKNGGELKGSEIINAGILDVTTGGIVTADIETQGLLRSSSGIEDLVISGDLTSNTSGVSFDYLVSGNTLLHDTYVATGDVVLNDVLFLVGRASMDLEGQVAELISGSTITAADTFSVRFIDADGNTMSENPQSILSNFNAGVELDFTLTDTALSVSFAGISNLITDGILT